MRRSLKPLDLQTADWSKPFALWVWFPLACACFFSGGILSAHFFDGPFDWRYRTLSALCSEATNPHGYIYCCLGLMISFGMGLPLCEYIRRKFEMLTPHAARFSYRALAVGFLGAIAVGLERLFAPVAVVGLPKAHEYVSIVTFFGLLLGLAGFWFCLTRWLTQERHWPAWSLALLFLVSAGPVLGTGLSQGYLYFFPNNLGWVDPRWAELHVPLYLSFAFWEWLSATGIFVYLFLILLLLPARTRDSDQPTSRRSKSQPADEKSTARHSASGPAEVKPVGGESEDRLAV